MEWNATLGLWFDPSSGAYYDDQGNQVNPGVDQTSAGASTTGGGGAPASGDTGPAGASGPSGPAGPGALGVPGAPAAGGGTLKVPISHVDLGTHIRTYFGDGSYEDLAKGQLPPQVNPNVSQVHTTERLIDPNQIAVEQLRAKNALDIANATNQRQTQADLGFFGGTPTLAAQIAAGHMVGGAPTEAARQFDSTQALAYFKDLAAQMANPRNFVQNFFQSRGQVAPGAAQGQGNVDAIQRFLPFLLGGAQDQAAGSGGARGAYQTQGADLPHSAPMQTTDSPQPGALLGNGGASSIRLSGPGANAPVMGGPTPYGGVGSGPAVTSSTPNPNPGQPFFSNAADSQAYQDAHPVDHSRDDINDLRRSPLGYARGGVLTETVVGKGTATGRPYVFNENPARPEGVVPADVLPRFLQQRHGQSLGAQRSYLKGGIIGADASDPYAVDPYAAGPSSSGGYMPPASQPTTLPGQAMPWLDPYQPTSPADGVPPSTPIDTGASAAPTSSVPYNGPGDINAPGSAPATAPVSSPFGQPANLPADNTGLGMQGTGTGAATPGGFSGAAAAPVGGVSPIVNQPNPTNTPPDPRGFLPQFMQQPIGQPQASNNFNASTPPTTGVTPAQASPSGTFGAQSGNMPSFLPGEDQMNPILQAMQQSQAIPPFLTRLLAQQKGVDSLSTSQPNPLVLPNGLPIASNLSYEQMAPSEQQALLSYASSLGVTPEDYLAYIKMLSPRGAQAQAPVFGNRFTFNALQR